MHSQPYFSNANKLCCAFQSRIGNPTSKTWGSAFIFISHSRYSKEQLLYKIQFNQDKALDHWTYDLPRAQKEVTGIFIGTSEQSTAPCTVCTLGDIGNQRDLLHPMSAASKSLYCLCIWCCEQLDFKTMEQTLFWWVPLCPAQPAWQSSKRRNPSGNRSLAGGYKYLISLLRSCTGETREPITKIILATCFGLDSCLKLKLMISSEKKSSKLQARAAKQGPNPTDSKWMSGKSRKSARISISVNLCQQLLIHCQVHGCNQTQKREPRVLHHLDSHDSDFLSNMVWNSLQSAAVPHNANGTLIKSAPDHPDLVKPVF